MPKRSRSSFARLNRNVSLIPGPFAAGGFHSTIDPHSFVLTLARCRTTGIVRADLHEVVEGRAEGRL